MKPGDRVLVVWDESCHDYAPGKVEEYVVEGLSQRVCILTSHGRSVEARKEANGWFEFDDPTYVLKIYKLEEV